MKRLLKPATTALMIGGSLALAVSTASADEFTLKAAKASAHLLSELADLG